MAETAPENEPIRVAPSARLSRGGLIAALMTMVAVGLGVYALFPESVGGPELPVSVSLGQEPVQTTSGKVSMLTEVVKVTNRADHQIGRLSIELNDQYLIMQSSPLAAGETLTLPQSVFTDKRSSQRFDPNVKQVTEVVVTGQLPNNSRGVSRFEFGQGSEQGH